MMVPFAWPKNEYKHSGSVAERFLLGSGFASHAGGPVDAAAPVAAPQLRAGLASNDVSSVEASFSTLASPAAVVPGEAS